MIINLKFAYFSWSTIWRIDVRVIFDHPSFNFSRRSGFFLQTIFFVELSVFVRFSYCLESLIRSFYRITMWSIWSDLTVFSKYLPFFPHWNSLKIAEVNVPEPKKFYIFHTFIYSSHFYFSWIFIIYHPSLPPRQW